MNPGIIPATGEELLAVTRYESPMTIGLPFSIMLLILLPIGLDAVQV